MIKYVCDVCGEDCSGEKFRSKANEKTVLKKFDISKNVVMQFTIQATVGTKEESRQADLCSKCWKKYFDDALKIAMPEPENKNR